MYLILQKNFWVIGGKKNNFDKSDFIQFLDKKKPPYTFWIFPSFFPSKYKCNERISSWD